MVRKFIKKEKFCLILLHNFRDVKFNGFLGFRAQNTWTVSLISLNIHDGHFAFCSIFLWVKNDLKNLA